MMPSGSTVKDQDGATSPGMSQGVKGQTSGVPRTNQKVKNQGDPTSDSAPGISQEVKGQNAEEVPAGLMEAIMADVAGHREMDGSLDNEADGDGVMRSAERIKGMGRGTRGKGQKRPQMQSNSRNFKKRKVI